MHFSRLWFARCLHFLNKLHFILNFISVNCSKSISRHQELIFRCFFVKVLTLKCLFLTHIRLYFYYFTHLVSFLANPHSFFYFQGLFRGLILHRPFLWLFIIGLINFILKFVPLLIDTMFNFIKFLMYNSKFTPLELQFRAFGLT